MSAPNDQGFHKAGIGAEVRLPFEAHGRDVVVVFLDWTSEDAGNRHWATNWTPYIVALVALTIATLAVAISYQDRAGADVSNAPDH